MASGLAPVVAQSMPALFPFRYIALHHQPHVNAHPLPTAGDPVTLPSSKHYPAVCVCSWAACQGLPEVFLAHAVCIEASHVSPPLPSVTVEKLLGQGFTPTPRTAPCGRPCCYQPTEFER